MYRKAAIGIAAVVVLLSLGLLFVTRLPAFTVDVPDWQVAGEPIYLNQGWSETQRVQFWHTPQGTRLVPHAWFMAFEQPCFSLTACAPFSDPGYLSRFGFIESKPNSQTNPDGLPVGFAFQKAFYDPMTGITEPVLGLTCAACHTGELRYGKYSIRIDGAPATIEVTQFQKALGLAMAFTKIMPFRYARFEAKILGTQATSEQKAALKKGFSIFLENAKAEIDTTTKSKIYANPAGFSRTDALTRIGNQVFAVDMQKNNNFAVSDAPVRFPQIWDASWFNWVQYNSSIADPMVRNIGEALGVRAVAKLYGPDALEFKNSINVEGLRTVELLLSGTEPYAGLQSPKWPSVFPTIDAGKASHGAELYTRHCSGCHLPPVADLIADSKSERPVHWWKNKQGHRFLIVTDVPMAYVGTDPHEAADFIARTADADTLKAGRVSAAAGLDLVTRGIASKYYLKAAFSPEKQVEWSGGRDPADPAVRAPPFYKARPLNGIWAVGPFLHNGSVPSLYELLSPQEDRPVTFWTGSKTFDPVKVGHDTSKLKGGYLFDVSRPGNSNKGHLFKEGPRGNGVVGPALSPDDRWAVIEYLKSL